LVLGKLLDRLPRVVGNLYVLLVLLLNFVLFRGPGLQEGLSNLQAMLGLADLPWSSPETIFHLRSYSFTLLLAVIGATPLLSRLVARIRSSSARERVLNLLEPLVLSALLLLVTGYLTDGYFSPYAFFKF
jgi:alginate O-acetyltransferase complex protein AlgI